MNPFYDETVIHKCIFSRWHWLYLWIFPTYAVLGDESITFFKNVFGRIFIVGEEPAPWMIGKNK